MATADQWRVDLAHALLALASKVMGDDAPEVTAWVKSTLANPSLSGEVREVLERILKLLIPPPPPPASPDVPPDKQYQRLVAAGLAPAGLGPKDRYNWMKWWRIGVGRLRAGENGWRSQPWFPRKTELRHGMGQLTMIPESQFQDEIDQQRSDESRRRRVREVGGFPPVWAECDCGCLARPDHNGRCEVPKCPKNRITTHHARPFPKPVWGCENDACHRRFSTRGICATCDKAMVRREPHPAWWTD
jgi:hypothetical protein